MSRLPKPWLRDQIKSWSVKIGGTQHPLGKDKKEADKAYHRLKKYGRSGLDSLIDAFE